MQPDYVEEVAEDPDEAPEGDEDSGVPSRRRKRETEYHEHKYLEVVMEPFRTVSKVVTDKGVMYDISYNASLCPCEEASKVKLELCLLDLVYSDDLNDKQSSLYRNSSIPVLGYVIKYLSQLKDSDGLHALRRISDVKYNERDDGYTKLEAMVELSTRLYSPEYWVKTTIEISTRATCKIYVFKTNPNTCLEAIDKTVAIPIEKHPLDFLRYICIPVALGILALVIFCICVGKKDSCKVCFW
ncbi:uncharacterized protein LOC121876713 [Homarus americanus]|uniref:uncharacterized protein LOC121876713 n=1 Tax=Homarus americanus TaxID=6706 RepID=UPI001C47D2FD|nr:uncharacterized protein LOC121876713 [Homarus americanus]